MPQNHELPDSNHARAHRVIASLNRDQVDFLDKIGKDALFSSGVKLSRTEILSAMVNALKRFDLTGDGVTTATRPVTQDGSLIYDIPREVYFGLSVNF